MNNSLSVQNAKRQLPLPQLMAKLGFGEFAKHSCRCPFHQDESGVDPV